MTGVDARRVAVPGIRRIVLGDLTCTYVPDGQTPLAARGWLPTATEEFWDDPAHRCFLDPDGALTAGVGGLLVEDDASGEAMLIDAGLGPVHFETPFGALAGGALLANLERVDRGGGSGPDLLSRITTVALTHPHLDHAGWLARPIPGTDRLPFAHASVAVGRDDWEQRHLLASHGVGADLLAVFERQVRLVTAGEEIWPGVSVVALPGHTPGHVGYRISSQGVSLIAFGDALHTPLQVEYPQLAAAGDLDPRRAAAVRQALVASLADGGETSIAFGVHFADCQFGVCARRDDGRIHWRPLPV
ncbi:MBL fold metallo-hydrolase [Nocardia sp. alder85J]|uniref:MBL fold metallo-hydrolase n=1 Tax=Nocardia sp. alder85J TaxID=2862949 RepID=UPI001CD6AC49|nr:MBL fold metallo-hydrolase [Nocardia sp. alder85J]MCX4097677.1 MBL fold metallo-hydrolase [Nocardia sp. alder85J]